MDMRVKLLLVSGAHLHHARTELSVVGRDGERRRVMDALLEAGSGAVPYPHSSHYLAFMLAYLTDEGVLSGRDWELSASLRKARGKRLTDLLPRAGVKLDELRAERYDVLDLRREFHGGGQLNDPQAGDALLDAIGVLRENFERLDADGALVVAF